MIAPDLNLPVPLASLLSRPMTEQFPGLRSGTSRFDGPGGALTHRAVSAAMVRYLAGPDVADPAGQHPAAVQSRGIVEWAGARFRALIGAAGGPVSFGANMSTLTILFLRELAPRLGPGDEIVCTTLDHAANVDPWIALARERGAVVRLARTSVTGELPVESISEHLTSRTRWVAVTGGSNVLGTAPDISAICAAARSVGARTFVDGVQMLAHRAVDVTGWGCDAFVTSADKWYGPHCGVLWTSDEVAALLIPRAGRSYTGTTNVEAVLGTGVAAEVLLGWDRQTVFRHGLRLTAMLIEELRAITGVRVLGPGPEDPRIPIVAFQLDGRTAAAVVHHLVIRGVSVSHGDFSARAALTSVAPGRPEAVRAGILRYTSRQDVRALVTAVEAISRLP
jgi:selenocysteine lyase/cysteine desulfurase